MDYNTSNTGTGLSRTPYVRDTRRSIGIDNFRLQKEDLNGNITGVMFSDRIGIGNYFYAD